MTDWLVTRVELSDPGGDEPSLGRPALLVFPADILGEELAGRIAAKLGATILGRITRVAVDADTLIAHRLAYGGRVEIGVRVAPGLSIATMNNPDMSDGIVVLKAPKGLPLERRPIAERKAPLEGAKIVVGGGRGLDADDFARLGELADLLGGAVGGSLPAVDLGLVTVSRQIGQSGRFVTPDLYVAVGLSGTPQHLAGIGEATRMIALNKDADAPIFQFADVGVVGDAKTLLPLLVTAVRDRIEAHAEVTSIG